MKTVGIFAPGQNGDVLTASSVLRYRNELWGDCKIVWFIEDANRDLLKYQDVELRTFPRGFGYPEMVVEENAKLLREGKEPAWENWLPLVNENNHLNTVKAQKFPSLEGIGIGYFPVPWMLTPEKRHGIDYANCSKIIFGVPMDWEWHPVLKFSDEERKEAKDFVDMCRIKKIIGGVKLFTFNSNSNDTSEPMIDRSRKVICLETFAGSGQSKLNDAMVRGTIKLCEDILGACTFIFMSHKYLNGNENFPIDLVYDKPNITFANLFTVRQCALIVEQADLLISVSSGITVAASAWDLAKTPIIQFCGSGICSTVALAKGRLFELVTTDERLPQVAETDFMLRLESLLKNIK